MPSRNVGKLVCFPAWGESLAENVGSSRNKSVTTANATTATRSGKTPVRYFALSSIPLTALLAVLSSTPVVFAQDNAPAPVAPATVPAPVVPAQSPVGDGVPQGRIRVFVRDALSKQFLNDAAVFFDDPTLTDLRSNPFYVGDTTRTDGARPLAGVGFTISDPLPTHQWVVVVLKEGYQTGRAIIEVLPDRTVEVTVYLRFRERVEPFVLLSTRDTTNNTRRTLPFVRNVPVGAGNRQNIDKVIASAPGFVRNSLGQVHPRGQRFGVANYLDGYLLPSLPTGLLQGFIPQEAIAQYDIRTGGLSAEFGGDVGAAVNLTTRRVGVSPIIEGMVTTADYNGSEAYITVGQRFPLRGRIVAQAARDQAALIRSQATASGVGGASIAQGSEPPPVLTPSFGYLLHVGQRNTDVVAEAPQQKMTLNNRGHNDSVFGKIDYTVGPLTQIYGIVDINGSRSGIANRSRAGGVGFLNQLEAAGSVVPAQTINNTPSQDEELQRQYQKENNSLGLVQIRRVLRARDTASNPDSSLTLTVGAMENQMRLENQNPNLDPRDVTNPNSPLYRRNSSLEFNPDVKRDYSQFQSQLDLVLSRGNHVLKGGVLINDYTSTERYRLEPGSQVALDALYARSPLLVPPGTAPNGSGLRDGLGNLLVSLDPSRPAVASFGQIRREGSYTGAYIQDTWAFNPVLTINAGIRFDDFQLTRITGSTSSGLPGNPGTSSSELSPRINVAYQLPQRGFLGFLGGGGATRRAVFRAGFNRLFQRPPLGQGTYFGTSAIRPQTGDSIEVGLEKQLGANQVIKGTLYTIDFQNYLDVEGLFPGAQFSTGALVLVNYPRAKSQGFELSYNFNPTFRNNNPLSLFATYTNGSVKFQERGNSFDSLGRPVLKERPDFDQEHTLNFGFSYRFPANYTLGVSSYIGSGLYGSRRPGTNDRDGIAEVNLRLSTSPRFFQNTFGLDISVENLLDQQNRYNFNTAFEGSRVQTGRRLMTSVYTRF